MVCPAALGMGRAGLWLAWEQEGHRGQINVHTAEGARALAFPLWGSMGPIFARNAWTMIAAVLAGIAVVALVGCQWQMAALDQTQTCLPTHHRASASSATAGLHCPARHCPGVTVPMAVSLAPVELVLPYTTTLMAHPTEFALPPFIPPEEVWPA